MMLIKLFEELTIDPKNLKEIKALILQLALQGKLTREYRRLYKSGESGSELLKKVRRENILPVINIEDLPFVLPTGWACERIGNIMELINGRAFKPSEWSNDGLPIIRIQNLNNVDAPFNYCNFRIDDKYLVKDNDLLIGWSGTPGTSFGAFIWKRGNAVLNQHIFKGVKNSDLLSVEFLKLAINSRLEEMISKAHGGVGLQHITKAKFERIIIPIPPVDEQNEIIRIVNQLYYEVDKLEVLLKDKLDLKERLSNSALKELVDVNTKESWTFVKEHFNILFNDGKNIKKLRESILQLAVQGKLTSQVETDEPASELLKRIKSEKQKLVKEGKAKKDKELPPIREEEIPFELPKGWVWCKLGEIGEIVGGIQKTPARRPMLNSFPYLRVANVQRNQLVLDEIEYFELFQGDLEKWRLEKHDLLIVEGNGSANEIGRCAIWNGQIDNCVHQNHLIRFRPSTGINPYYILKYLNSPFGIKGLKEKAITTTGLFTLSVNKVINLLIPLPPCSMQQNIVVQVQQLMQHVNELEDQVCSGQKQAQQLLQAVLKEAFAGKSKEYISSESLTLAAEA